MAALEHSYRYAADSSLRDVAGGQVLSLASDLGQTPDRAGHFLTARALYPMETARALRAVSEIVGSRFYVPPAMLARILAEADPVATVSPGAVRFEGFSACCSAYIRLDLDDAALDVSERRNGTTNVDFGPELRGALASVAKGNRLDLTIGAEAVAIAKDGHEIVEKKVPLPLRWLKGFAEVQIVLAGMEPAFRLPRVAAQRFLRQCPRGKSDHLQWASMAAGQARLSARETPGAVPLRGAHRLRVLEALAPMAGALEVHVNRATGASAWTLDFGALRLCLVLNAEPWRGFSGDGGLLSRLAASDDAALRALKSQLHWQDRIEPDGLAKATGLDPDAVQGGLAQLAATGLVGFDLTRGSYFHRVLPFRMDRIEALNPRLKAARKLLDAGAVRMTGDGAEVVSDAVTHRISRQDGDWRCTCPWHAKNGGQRGPCKHVLAVEMYLENRQ